MLAKIWFQGLTMPQLTENHLKIVPFHAVAKGFTASHLIMTGVTQMRVRISCKYYIPGNQNFRKKSYQELHVYEHHVKLQAGILILWNLEATDTCWLPSIFCSSVPALLVSKRKQFVIRLSFSVNMFRREWKSAIIHNFFPPLMTMASSWILLNVANPLILRNKIWASW